jgi:pilin isopeptide linkage protein
MKMKKIAAIIFSAAMVLNMGAAAMAEDTLSVNISKSYTAVNDGTTKPEETFNFTVSDGVVTEADEGVTAPEIADFSIAFTGNDATATSKTNTLQLPTFGRVGIYTYTISETPGNTAGVSYSTTPITMQVTVTQGETDLERSVVFKDAAGEKLTGAAFVNTYRAGNISISKKVTGNMGDTSKYFDVKVTVTNPVGKDASATYAVSGGSNDENPTTITAGTATTFKLKADDTITIANVPYDATYTVVEADYSAEKYTATYSGSDGSDGTGTVSDATETVEITNNKGVTVETGINLDSMPYIMILALVAVCAVVMFARKRFSANR